MYNGKNCELRHNLKKKDKLNKMKCIKLNYNFDYLMCL